MKVKDVCSLIQMMQQLRNQVTAYFACLKSHVFVCLLAEDWYPEGKQNIQVGHLREALIPSLNPWTFYHLRLFAENQLGKSKEGKVLQVNERPTFKIKSIISVSANLL